jgi:hypothetical protein
MRSGLWAMLTAPSLSKQFRLPVEDTQVFHVRADLAQLEEAESRLKYQLFVPR